MAETLEFYAKDAIERMVALGVYKKEFSPAVLRYADFREQYDILTARWRRERFRVYSKTGDEQPSKRNPLCVAIESLRKDITALEQQLCLTPQGLLKVKEDAFAAPKKVGGLASVLSELNSG